MPILSMLVSCSNLFRVFGSTTGSTEVTTLEASRNPMRYACLACITYYTVIFSHSESNLEGCAVVIELD
jgi:hypothetical protein